MTEINEFGPNRQIESQQTGKGFFAGLWELFKSLDRFTKLFIITALLITASSPYLVTKFLTKAAEPVSFQTNQNNSTPNTAKYPIKQPTSIPVPSSAPVCPAIVCDINTDKAVNINDGNFINACWGKIAPLGDCQKADVNCDDIVDVTDVQQYAYKCPQSFQ